MINNVTLVGRITKDPELRYTPNGNANCSFSLAVDRGVKDANGNKQADFINCVAWKQSAEFIGNYIKKGNLMGLTGSIQTRSYQNQQGSTVYITEVICNRVVSLQPKDDTQQQNQGYQGQQNQGYQGQQNKAQQPSGFDVSGKYAKPMYNQEKNPFNNQPNYSNIDDDPNMPF